MISKEFDKGIDVHSDKTQDKLLDAAEALFCEKGFEGSSVRDLTTTAGCNVASVNYHFGGKDKLYVEMFRRQIRKLFQRHKELIDTLGNNPDATLEDLVRGAITEPLEAIENKEKSAAVMKLLVREVLNQHVHKNEIIGDLKTEFFPLFYDAMIRFCPGIDSETARLCMFTLDALVIHTTLFYETYQETVPELGVDGIIDHIVRFASAGIRTYARGVGK